jgi:hypothetical protein
MSNYHGEDASGISAAMMFMLVLVIAAVVAIGVLAWAPWNEDNDDVIIPGQGGEDAPRQQMTTPTLPNPGITPAVPRVTPGIPGQ